MFDKEFQLTPRLGFLVEIQYDTHDKWESSAGLSYRVHKHISFSAKWHSDYKWGAGLVMNF